MGACKSPYDIQLIADQYSTNSIAFESTGEYGHVIIDQNVNVTTTHFNSCEDAQENMFVGLLFVASMSDIDTTSNYYDVGFGIQENINYNILIGCTNNYMIHISTSTDYDSSYIAQLCSSISTAIRNSPTITSMSESSSISRLSFVEFPDSIQQDWRMVLNGMPIPFRNE